MNLIELKQVSKVYGHGVSQVQALKEVNFAAAPGELNLVIGPSGSGKSTFLTIAGGLQTPTSGQVLINGQDPAQLTAQQRDHLRLTRLGFILQAYNLLPYLTVHQQFELVDRVKKDHLTPAALQTLLTELGIDQLQAKYPDQLSGGQNQRVAIARALYANPAIVLADEPTAALDSQRVQGVGQLFKTLAVKHHKAVVLVTHDQRLLAFADHCYQIEDGQMTQLS
ncbi:ABC transporter ATP-binding protein [Limosilactobacillus ingluviei]|uniref:Putative hemin import ATP-binding protein HrtA n=1 Tax=Limosilactobacillus ingluviei DSM 15946 TaxID=1423760 RepID=A0A0R1UE74_9LACO|nr:ABC transporter ATP-binding protein [Limosilactobacillus ingluviei]KRL91760.1 ABC transporter ATP-binding component [Limosilactobacillus ingluviei DSM 15946]